MKTDIALFEKFGLATSSSNFTYSEVANSFLGNAFTSLAGNTYFNEVRFVEGLLIKEDVGQGYTYTFLNGLRVYDIKTKTLLCEKTYHNKVYSLYFLKSEVKRMLQDLIISSAKKEGVLLAESEVGAKLEQIINNSFAKDQRQMLIEQTQLYLNS